MAAAVLLSPAWSLSAAPQRDGSAAAPGAAAGSVAGRDLLRGGTTARDVRRYWTPQRMRAAKPLDLERRTPAAAAAQESEAGEAEPTGTPFFVAANPPESAPGPTLQRGEVSGGESGIVLQAAEVPDTTAYPARTHGRAFFKFGPDLYTCSATVVSTEERNVVFTAGHCVNSPEGMGWASNWLFVPGYRDGSAPFGEFPATTLRADAWIENDHGPGFDFAAAVLATNGSGEKVESAVGGRGIAFNQERDQLFTSWGYPAESPFTGQRLYTCQSRVVAFRDRGPDVPIGISCDMTGGSSGGGWVIADQYVNSVNSHRHGDYPGVMFGPYFGEDAGRLYLAVCGCARDVSPPGAMIDSGPSGPTNDASPSFGFTSTEPAGFQCRLDGGGWTACSSARKYADLADGNHLFSVRAIDGSGNIGLPASRGFRVDTAVDRPRVSAAKRQVQGGRRIAVEIFVKAQEPVTANAAGKITVKGKRTRNYKLKRQVEPVRVFGKLLRLRPAKRKHNRKILKALEKGKKTRARVKVKLTDGVDNSVREKRVVRLK